MFRRRAHRLSTIFLMVVALLYSQLALANYLCPSGPAEAAMEMAPGAPCEGMATGTQDQDQPALCHQHCVNAPQSFDPLNVPAVSLPAIVQVVFVALPGTGLDEVRGYAPTGEARPPPSPLFLSTLRLRV